MIKAISIIPTTPFKRLKEILIYFFFLLSSFTFTFSQVKWERTYGAWGKETAEAIVSTYDGGYLVAGSSSSFQSQSQCYFLKLDGAGEILWSKQYGGEEVETAKDIIKLSDSGFAAVGITNSFGNMYQGYFLRLNALGDTLFTKTYGGEDWDLFNAVYVLPDSGFVVVGETYSYGAGDKDAYILRLNKVGDTLWTKTYGDVHEDAFNDVLYSLTGDIVAIGYTTDTMEQQDAVVVRYDLNGDIISSITYGEGFKDYFTKGIELENNELILIGSKEQAGGEDYDGWIVRLEANGAFKGEQINGDFYPGVFDQYGKVVTKYQQENRIVVGNEQMQDGFQAPIISGEFVNISGAFPGTANTDSAFQKYVSSSAIHLTGLDTCMDGGYVYCAYGDGKIGTNSNGTEKIYVLKVSSENQTACGDVNGGCILHKYDLSAGFASVKEEAKETFRLYPNPLKAGEVLTIVSKQTNGIIEIWDNTGKQLQTTKLNKGNNTISLTGSKGMYYVKVIGENYSYVKSLVVY